MARQSAIGNRQSEVSCLLLLLALSAVGQGGRLPVPPARPPRLTLTCKGKEVFEGRRVLYDQDTYPREPAGLVEGPAMRRQGGGVTIAFALDRPDDVLVRIVDPKGHTVRNLACGVLGDNAPAPFQAGSLKQRLTWDGKDDEGKPAPKGCKAQVRVGLTPRFDRFVGYEPAQLLHHVRGLEVDPQGRLYVSVIPAAMAEAEILRFDRNGRYLDTVNPANPNLLPGKIEDLYSEINHLDGVALPAYRGFRPFFWFYCTGGAFHPIRIARDGQVHIACVKWSYRSRDAGPFIFTAEHTEPLWFRKPMWTQLTTWAVDDQGFAYVREVRGDKLKGIPLSVTIRKLSIATGKPAEHFEYHGTEKLGEKRAFLGSPEAPKGGVVFTDAASGFHVVYDASAASGDAIRDGTRFAVVRDLTIGPQGRIVVADARSLKVYAPSGRFLRALDGFALGGKHHELGEPYGVRAAAGALYVVAKLDGRAKAHLVKFTLGADAAAKAVWRLPLDGLAKLVAVDEWATPPILWVGNGGGLATITRVVDPGSTPGPPEHIGGLRRGVFSYPHAIALDGRGRIFVQDFDRQKLIRTNDDGSEWLEAPDHARDLYALFCDKTRGHLYRVDGGRKHKNSCRRYSLDFSNPLAFDGTDHTNLGGVDAQGNLYAAQDIAATWKSGKGPRIDQFGPDGRLKAKGFCWVYAGRGACAVGPHGCLYVMDTCETACGGRKGAPGFGAFHNLGRPPGPRWERGGRKLWSQSDVCYVAKFAPSGGRRGGPSEHWAHLGASPVMFGCSCRTTGNNVAVDQAARVFAADATMYHVKALDAAGNLITRIGAWGHHDCRGPRSKFPKPAIAFDWPHSLDAWDDALYVSDKRLRRIVKVRLDYRHTREAPLP